MEDRNYSTCCQYGWWVAYAFLYDRIRVHADTGFPRQYLQHYDSQSEEKPQKLTSFIPKIEERINKVRGKRLKNVFAFSKSPLSSTYYFVILYLQINVTGTDWLTQEENINIVILRKMTRLWQDNFNKVGKYFVLYDAMIDLFTIP